MGIIQQLFYNTRGTVIFFLLALPGRLLAISAHEAAHAWVADRCGDPTARLMGRVTLNPIKHLDLVGALMMIFVGIGWAKPVPVNPLNYRNYRRDDFKVSIAGITMNLILFLCSTLILYAVIGLAFAHLPRFDSDLAVFESGAERFLMEYDGEMCYLWKSGSTYMYTSTASIVQNAMYSADVLIVPVFGEVAGYLCQMLVYSMVVNVMLAIFNLIPLPPLDGYHVLNDLVLKKPLFVSPRASAFASIVLFALFFFGILGSAMSTVSNWVFAGVGDAACWVFRLMGMA